MEHPGIVTWLPLYGTVTVACRVVRKGLLALGDPSRDLKGRNKSRPSSSPTQNIVNKICCIAIVVQQDRDRHTPFQQPNSSSIESKPPAQLNHLAASAEHHTHLP
ncbi:hypothetical protein FJTKL_10359 [Diaporthe vaccinii]|uniref:Uncharacterized protein n=1 Tax=Diaporthe vaccinii TaxID=105482 RepID=A0ABR4EK01_9PEZI